jgi:phage gp36-like protein
MKPFYATTEDFIESEKTTISEDVSASATPVSVDSNQGFSIDDWVIIGTKGNDKAEIKQITGTPSSILEVEALTFDHKEGEPIVKIAFNQRRLYGSDKEDGDYSLIETKTIEVDNPQGTYFSYSGTDYDWFKATYYNSETEAETDIDDAVAIQAGETQRYCSVYDVREEAGFLNNPYVSDGRINLLILQAESEVKGSIAGRYSLPLSEIPDIIKTATILLAAGRLLYREYGYDTEGLAKDGLEKMKEARSILKGISKGEIVLLDSDDSKLTQSSTDEAEGWPNDTTANANDDDAGGDVNFRISKEF